MACECSVFNRLSNEILCEIFSVFLSIQDVSRFDTAICNHNQRSVLKVITSACIWYGDLSTDYDSEKIA
jgi:hypothetical protein